jgi:hypothetical protein
MKKLDIPCGEGNVAVIMEKDEMELIADLLYHEMLFKRATAHCAEAMEKEFKRIAGLEKEKPEAKTDEVPDIEDTPF